LLLLSIFTEMRKRNKESFLNIFIDEVNKQKEEENKEEQESERENRIEILNPSSAFYYFAISTLADLFEDIEIFNINSDGIIAKIRVILSHSCAKVRSFAQIPLSFYSHLRVHFSLSEYLNTPRIQNVVAYLNNTSEYVIGAKNLAVQKVQKQCTDLKQWVSSSVTGRIHPFLHSAFEFSFVKPKIFLHEKIWSPSKDVFIVCTDKCVNVAFSVKTYSKEKFDTFVNALSTQFGKVFGEGPYFSVNFDKEGKYYTLQINKNVILPFDYHKFFAVLHFAIEQAKSVDLKGIYQNGKNKTYEMKDYMVHQFRKMVGCCNCEVQKEIKTEEQKENEKTEEHKENVMN